MLPKLIQHEKFNGAAYFFISKREIPFSGKFDPKIKIISLCWNLLARLVQYPEFNNDVHFFHFLLEITLLGKFSSGKLNCQFNVKFCT